MIIEHTLLIAAPIDKVYAVSQDYAVRYDWDPFPDNIQLLDGATDIKPGVKVLVAAKSGLQMEVEFVQVCPPTRAAIVMTKGPIFLEKFAGSWIFSDLGNGRTAARFRYAIEVKKWMLPPLTVPLVRLYFNKVVNSRMQGLKNYCETQHYSFATSGL